MTDTMTFKMLMMKKNLKNDCGKCLGLPITSYGPAPMAGHLKYPVHSHMVKFWKLNSQRVWGWASSQGTYRSKHTRNQYF